MKLLGIGREDKDARIDPSYAVTLDSSGRHAALFCFVDRQMGPPQWSDLGMFLQTFMLLAQEAGLDTCAQEAWSMKNDSVSEFVGAEDDILFCGMAMGYKRKSCINNKLSSKEGHLNNGQNFL